jgi:anti-anti-sigma factor
VVINVSSKLDLEASDIRRVGELVLHRHPAATIIVNLALVEYIGSTFLDRLVLLKKRVQAARGRLILCGFNSVIQEVFRITRLDGFFEITDEAPPRRKDA